MRALLIIFSFSFLALSTPVAAKEIVRQQLLMGNIPVTLTIDTTQKKSAQAAMTVAFNEARRLEALLSDYLESSDIGRINKAKGNWVSISDETRNVLKLALKAFERTGGKFDITFKSRIPSITSHTVQLDKNRVRLKDKRTQIGVSGIAKGYIVDAMADVLIKAGFSHFLVNAGDIYAAGKWKIPIKNPRDLNKSLCHINLNDQALSSSGLYERGRHIIIPKTRKAANDRKILQSTIIANNSVTADAFDNAAFLMTSAEHKKLSKQADIDAVIIVQADGVRSYGASQMVCDVPASF